MNRQEVPILGALVVQAAVGFAVFVTNRHRKATQSFLILSIAMICWLASLYFGSTSHDLAIVAANMRVAFAAAVLILLALNFLRLSTVKPDATWRDLLRHSGGWIILALATIIFCQSDLLVRGARFPNQPRAAPQPIYNWGVYLYAYFFTGALVVLLVASLRDLRNSSGRIRSELGYFLLGSTSILVLTLGAYQILRFFVPPSRLFWFAPLRAVLFTLIIAYGISTRKIMDVGLFLRRAISYGVLTTYLLALYGGVWWLVVQVTASLFYSTDHTFAHIAAALVCTFAMAPARGFSQSLADRLFVGGRGIDFRATVSKSAVIL
jgi:hypothetical protein